MVGTSHSDALSRWAHLKYLSFLCHHWWSWPYFWMVLPFWFNNIGRTNNWNGIILKLLDKRHIQDWSWYEHTTKHAGFDTYLMLASNHQARTPLFSSLDGMVIQATPTAALKRLLIDPSSRWLSIVKFLSPNHATHAISSWCDAAPPPPGLYCVGQRHLWQLIKPWWLLQRCTILNTLNQAPIPYSIFHHKPNQRGFADSSAL